MANLKEAFVVRPLPESDEFIITIGNHLATEEKFKSRSSATITLIREHQALEYGLVLQLDLEYRLDSFHVQLTYQKLQQPQ